MTWCGMMADLPIYHCQIQSDLGGLRTVIIAIVFAQDWADALCVPEEVLTTVNNDLPAGHTYKPT